ncbi:hypothetical protein [Magnetospirillum gryphiswaldense]|nr:hypothetical protein [Magnetospirillum gryphiswaldense]
MRVDGDIGVFREYCAANHKTLGCHGGAGDGVILVDLMHSDYHYLLRSLLLAKYRQLVTGGKLVGLLAHGLWMSGEHHDLDNTRLLARSFGVEDFVELDLAAQVAAATAEDHALAASLAGMASVEAACEALVELRSVDGSPVGLQCLTHFVRFSQGLIPSDQGKRLRALGQDLVLALSVARWAAALFARLDVAALVIGHSYYVPFGPVLESAIRRDVECLVFFFEYQDFSFFRFTAEHRRAVCDMAGAELAWSRFIPMDEAAFRAVFATPSDRLDRETAHKQAIRHSWWYGSVSSSFLAEAETWVDDIRRRAMGRQVVGIFPHLVSEPLSNGRFCYPTITRWIEDTLRVAVADSSLFWVFKPHPGTAAYGEDALVAEWKCRFDAPHVLFLPHDVMGIDMARAFDKAVTGFGTIGYLLPMDGIPVVHSGGGAYTDLGFSWVGGDRRSYLDLLARIGTLTLTPEQMRTARRYDFFRKNILGSPSVYLGPYQQFYGLEAGEHTAFWRRMLIAARTYHYLGDPAFHATERCLREDGGRSLNVCLLDALC